MSSLTSLLQTWLTTFLHTRVTSQKTGLLQGVTEVRVNAEECTGDTVTNSAGLTGESTTIDVSDNVVLTVSLSNIEWLVYDST